MSLLEDAPPPPQTPLALWVFVHDHLSAQQQGLQAAQVVAAWWRQHTPDSPAHAALMEWARGHGRVRLFQGGDVAELERRRVAFDLLAQDWSAQAPTAPPLVWEAVREAASVLQGALTAVGILWPDHPESGPLPPSRLLTQCPDTVSALTASFNRHLDLLHRLHLTRLHAVPCRP